MSSSSYGREVKDEEEDDPAKQADAENDEEDEEEDEDYVPEEQDEDDDSDDGGGFEEIDEVGPDEGGVEKRGKRGTASKDKQNRRPKRLKLGTVPPVQELNSPVSAEEEAARLAAAEKARADALWAELQSNTEPARKKSAADVTAPATKAITTSLTKPSASALDIKALLAKTKNSAGVAKSADSGMVTITQKLDFCGEEVVVTKRVRAGSKEELAHRELGGDVLKPKTAVRSLDACNCFSACLRLAGYSRFEEFIQKSSVSNQRWIHSLLFISLEYDVADGQMLTS
uniref:Uncharacterized protein n=1 Tax=Chrysotila carterae TaxID=13221 RepID=A0A7S4B788_CHRCT